MFVNIILFPDQLQALLSAGYNHSEWDCHATVSSVIDSMHPDGHYGNLAATVHVLPLLAGRHHGHMKSLEFDCPQGKTATLCMECVLFEV